MMSAPAIDRLVTDVLTYVHASYTVCVSTIRIDWPEGLVHERYAPAHRYASLPLAMAQAAWLSTQCGTALVTHHGATVAYYVKGGLSI